jgi:hypothetical protein
LLLDIDGVREAASFDYSTALAEALEVKASRETLHEEADEKRRAWAKAYDAGDKTAPKPASELEEDG